MVTRTFRVYGADGHRQAVSFQKSVVLDFSKGGRTRILDIRNADVTGTNDYTEIAITTDSAAECARELDGQITDGLFENYRTGKVEEVL